MPTGLYGKLPAKRDFVAANVSRRLLEVWEPWLQASVATSRQMLGEGWRDAYNSAPIWRFWLGAELLRRGDARRASWPRSTASGVIFR